MVELIWNGKYDEHGQRAAPLRVRLPFQTVETVNESAQQRQMALDLFSAGRPPEWRNRLIWGDKKYVLPALLDEFAGQVNLIYIDPPFATGADFSYNVQIGNESFIKEPSILEQKAYRDTWGRGLDSYLQWIFETTSLLRELLSDSGSLYLHCEPAVSHYIKIILDEAFGSEGFTNELVWKRTGSHGGAKRYGPIHDVILFYTKSSNFTWNPIHTGYSDDYRKRFSYTDPDGRQFQPISLIAAGTRKGSSV